jgi:hypothetical protein
MLAQVISLSSSEDEIAIEYRVEPKDAVSDFLAGAKPLFGHAQTDIFNRWRIVSFSFFDRQLARLTRAIERVCSEVFKRQFSFSDRIKRPQQVHATVQWLRDTFGESRVGRALNELHIDADLREREGTLFRVHEISSLFVRLMIITEDDIEELFSEIKKLPPDWKESRLRTIPATDLFSDFRTIKDKESLCMCSQQEIDALCQNLREMNLEVLQYITSRTKDRDSRDHVSFPVQKLMPIHLVAGNKVYGAELWKLVYKGLPPRAVILTSERFYARFDGFENREPCFSRFPSIENKPKF